MSKCTKGHCALKKCILMLLILLSEKCMPDFLKKAGISLLPLLFQLPILLFKKKVCSCSPRGK